MLLCDIVIRWLDAKKVLPEKIFPAAITVASTPPMSSIRYYDHIKVLVRTDKGVR